MKPKIAIYSLTSCEGCQFAILDLGERFLEFCQECVDIGDFQLIEELKETPYYDIAFIEGSPITKENLYNLKRIRKKTKILVALSTCSTTGCVQKIKNYYNKEKILKKVYKDSRKIDNPKIEPLRKFVKVDLEIPGCPINKEEFLRIVYDLKEGKIPQIPQRPVCYECQIRKTDCLLQQGEACLGPVIRGGCEAVCPVANYRCEGCRGVIAGANIQSFQKVLNKIISKKELNQLLEKYGIKDEWIEALRKGKE